MYTNQHGNTVLVAIIIILLILGGYFLFSRSSDTPSETTHMDEQDTMMMEKDAIEDSGETMVKDEAMMEDKKPTTDTMMEPEDTMMQDDTSMMMEENTDTTGTFETYHQDKLALAEEGDVVLFFSASWCPTCRSLNKDIESNLSNIPANTHILKIDYDTTTDLKKKYGITYQHTFVQVDAQGNQIKKWGGSPTLEKLLTEIQ